MAQDIRKRFNEANKLSNDKMPKGHEARFLSKLDEALPVETQKNNNFSFYKIAASFVILLGLGYFVLNQNGDTEIKTTDEDNPQEVVTTKSLGEISPQLQKVEDYYLANINHELSKIKYTPESKELFDGYVERLEELSNEYDVLANELVTSGPNEDTVTALIDNLKLRLNLLYRLKEKLNELNNSENDFEAQTS